MLKQALSWPSRVNVDEVAAILFEAAYRAASPTPHVIELAVNELV
jgi:hypothetical protein